MFSRVFSIAMIPAIILMGIVSPVIYFWVGIDIARTESSLSAVLWFALYGHLLAMLGAAVLILPTFAVLAALAASAAWVFGLGWRLQKRGIESLPFKVSRKESEPIEHPDVFSH